MLKILLIEDAFGISNEAKKLVENIGYSVSATFLYSEEETILRYITENRIDLVVASIKLQKNLTIEKLLIEITSVNDTIQFLLVGKEHCTDYTSILVKNGINCYLCLPEDRKLIVDAILFLEKKQKKERIIRKKEKEELFGKFLEVRGELNIHERNKLFSEIPEKDSYQVAIVRILPPYRIKFQRGDCSLGILKGTELLYSQFENIEKCLIVKRNIDYWIFFWGGVEELEKSQEKLRSFLTDIREMNYSCFKIATWVAVSSKIEKITDLYQISYETSELLKERIIRNSVELLELSSWKEIFEIKGSGEFEIFNIRKTLLNALEMLDEEGIQRVLMQLRQNVVTNYNISGAKLYSLYKEVIATLFVGIDRQGVNWTDADFSYEYLLKEYDYFWNVENVFDTMCYYMCEGVRILQKHRIADEPVVIIRAKQYIREFFSMSLTLKEVSDYVGMSEAYFSNYFSRYTNQTFKQYLTNIRIRYAKQMLLDGNIGLADIAESVGYNDKKYFSRVFKRETGYTPGEYRTNKKS